MFPTNYWIVGAILGVLQILGILLSVYGFFLIKFNDLRHLGDDIKIIKDAQLKENEQIEQLRIGQATMKAVCEERSSMYKLNKKIGAIRNRKS